MSKIRVAPENATLVCLQCIEPGGKKRKCCNAPYCDHCYVRDSKCPNCDVPTKQEKLTGATYQVKIYSEHEECRICLEPGIKRSCCNNYYCDECYYKFSFCRSCGVKIGHVYKTGFQFFKGELTTERLLAVVLGWSITVAFVLIAAAGLALVITNEISTPIGIFDNHCYGLFKQCDLYVCIDLNTSVAAGIAPLSPLSGWQNCDLNSVVKLQAQACIFDSKVFQISGQRIGYDVCSKSFSQGVYIFEDTFEHWQNSSLNSNQMKSARWDRINKGIAAPFCGAGQVRGGSNALVFAGVEERYAITKDMDVSSGGWIEAEMFIPPIGFDVNNPNCKSGYVGIIYLDFSIDGGRNWTALQKFIPAEDRSDRFFPVKATIPPYGRTNATRFRFIQPIYEQSRDNWALDNVKVHRLLPTDWKTSPSFVDGSLKTATSTIQDAQCCADTDWCSKRLSVSDTNQCPRKFSSWFTGSNYLLRLQEIFVCVTTFLVIIKFIYISYQDWLMRSRVPFQDEVSEIAEAVFKSTIFTQFNRSVLPVKYRVTNVHHVEDYASSIHRAARMKHEFRSELDDGEGQGDMKRRQALIDKEKRKEERKLLKQKKRLLERMKNKNYKGEKLEEPSQTGNNEEKELFDKSFEEENEAANVTEVSKFEALQDLEADAMQAVSTVDLDLIRRQNMSLLRIPFEVQADERVSNRFFWGSWFVLVFFFLFEASVMKTYTIKQPIQPYGLFNDEIKISNVMVVLFALACDVKEIYSAIRQIIPFRRSWIPLVTIDLSDEVKSLFIGSHIIPIEDIKEYHTYSQRFIQLCFSGYVVGVFPWCLFAMLLREAYLDYASMRIVTPMLGSVMMLRAVLGPGVFVKLFFSLHYLFDARFEIREKIGEAFQQERTKVSAITTALSAAVMTAFFGSIIFFQWLAFAVAAAFIVGLGYGAVTGCSHNLPLKPWMYLTTLKEGVWLRVKKRQLCPCLYWCKFCTNIHNYDEVFVIHTTDEIKFLTILKGGLGQSEGLVGQK